jgi:uncharacterized membrane protein YkoI
MRGSILKRPALRNWRQTSLLLVSLGILAGLSAGASGKDDACKSSQDCALGAREQGRIRPLSEVLAAARAVVPGEVIKIELEREDGVWVYEIKILAKSGKRREVEINAETLAVIKVD